MFVYDDCLSYLRSQVSHRVKTENEQKQYMHNTCHRLINFDKVPIHMRSKLEIKDGNIVPEV